MPSGPIPQPSKSQTPQWPKKAKAAATGTSGSDKPEEPSTLKASEEALPMDIDASEDAGTWYSQVTLEDTRHFLAGMKRKRTDTGHQAASHPFPMQPGAERQEVVQAIYEHVSDWDMP